MGVIAVFYAWVYGIRLGIGYFADIADARGQRDR